ncbi:single-stranded-DNA-specific exonuclease RecJ [Asticcacaulis sp. BYS171W]|uniref:Single-stranded-DNA-specific exonuclease RecJ n=1 Tax=Asticcacaulis aquaticus TaxID=2984212 RepID=A0ABT5HP50_9CAUL|nr:single-stranded-DNA-specific exonuclease RecJ [Asticcacaulis aquaticus]MDC7681774.1 single-stranded-DNA-specific exonuclease RecJ [Asticcacaulis aquaticus]
MPDDIAQTRFADTLDPFLGVETSVTGRLWVDRRQARAVGEPELRRISDQLALKGLIEDAFIEPIARSIAGRGIAAEALDHYLKPTLKALFPEPETFMDMGLAVAAILDALQARQKVYVFADYDVDGATSAAQLVRWFRHMGHDLSVYVPDRILEGYGPSEKAFDRLKAEGADLVITVDCGASSHHALDYAAAIGLDVVVIDHHLMREDPPKCRAVVNPNRPGCTSEQGNLAAAGVVFVVLAALNREAEKRGLFADRHKPDLTQWLDLSALGAICDVTALTGFNRALATQGLKVMSRLENKGIRALMKVAGLEVTDVGKAPALMSVFHSGFVLGPRINAGGRIGRADLGVRLLSTESDDEALSLAQELDDLNKTRRDVEAAVQEEALAMAAARGLPSENDHVVIVAREDWHPGVIGIVAGRLRERWHKPVIVIGIDPVSGIGKGSGRSQAGINLGQAISAAYEAGLLMSGGGHAMAAGLSIEAGRVAELQAFLNDFIGKATAEADRKDRLEIDATLSAASATRALLDRFEIMAPFGQGNPEPLFALPHMRVGYASALKGGHVRCDLIDESGKRLKAIAWRAQDTAIGAALLNPAGAIHVAGRLKPDDYMGRNGVQFEIEDIAHIFG